MGGGAEKFAYYLARQFHLGGHEVCVLSLCPNPESDLRTLQLTEFPNEPLASRMGKHSILRFLAFRASGVTFVASARKAIANLLKEEDFDLVHSQTPASDMAAISAIRERRPKKVLTSHGYVSTYQSYQRSRGIVNSLGLPDQAVQRSLENWTIMHSDLVTAVSNSLRMNILDSLPAVRANLRVVHAQIPIELYNPRNKGSEFKSRYGITSRPTILYAGRINRSKGITNLIEAMSYVVKEVPEATLLIAGPVSFSQQTAAYSDGYLDEVKRIIFDRGLGKQTILAGHLSDHDMPDAYAAADVVVVPSIWQEPCSVSILEGMATGRPVVATNIGGNPELVADGRSGFLVPPFNTRELANRITKLLKDPEERCRLGAKGREIAETQFSCEVIANKMLRAYSSVLQH